MTESLIIPCAHCAGLNRIPANRLHDAPHCGRCKAEVLPHKPFDLQQSQFASQLKGDLPLLVDVWASWCGPCRSFAPTFAEAAASCRAAAAWPSSIAKPTRSFLRSWVSARFPACCCFATVVRWLGRAAHCHCRSC
ncbi:Thioredoxin 2 [Stutzerimonas stutzeri]